MPISVYTLKYLSLTFIAASLLILGFAVEPMGSILRGLYRIITEPAVLITDYIQVGGIGAAFVNAGALMLASVALLFILNVDITGLSVASVFLMGSFALFGKNICNVWPIIFGVFLYAKLQKEPFANYVHIALLASSIAPIVTEFLFVIDMTIWLRILISLSIGTSVGLLIAPLSAYVLQLHKGFNLYNVGFSVGVLGTLYMSLLKSHGYTPYSRMVWSTGNNLLLGLFLGGLFVCMIVGAIIIDRRALCHLGRLFKRAGTLPTDFITLDGFPAALFNMGLNGFVAMGYVLLVCGALNGPTIGGILTVAGFGAFGKHMRNIAPIFLGVFIGSITKTWSINDPTILLAALFGTSLAPIAGHYGWIWGVVAGYVNSSVVLNSGILHGGMNLYNTGFSAGIVAAAMIPILNAFSKKKPPPN